jgi:hypothetical protein
MAADLGSQRGLDSNLLKQLECPVCMECVMSHIKLCENGHSICSSFRSRVSTCPTCRGKFTQVRNLALENLARTEKPAVLKSDQFIGGMFVHLSVRTRAHNAHLKSYQAWNAFGPVFCVTYRAMLDVITVRKVPKKRERLLSYSRIYLHRNIIGNCCSL